MINDNDIFLENCLDIFALDTNAIIITYDTLFHQNLNNMLNEENKNIILKSSLLKSLIYNDFKGDWIILKNCHVTNVTHISNFISYTVRFSNVERVEDVYVRRKIKLLTFLGKKQKSLQKF